MNHKRTYKSGATKKAEKRKRELLAIQSSPYQKKLCFTTLDRIKVTDNNSKSKFSHVLTYYIFISILLLGEGFFSIIHLLIFINI